MQTNQINKYIQIFIKTLIYKDKDVGSISHRTVGTNHLESYFVCSSNIMII